MSRLTKEKKQQLMLVSVATVVVLLAIYYFIISPAKGSLNEQLTLTADAEKKYTEADRLVKRAAQVRIDLEEFNKRLATVESGFVTGDPNLWIRLAFERFRSQGPYKVEIPTFPQPVPAEVGVYSSFPYKAMIYRATGTAYYHDLGKFLADLENFFPFIRVQNLELTPEDSPTGRVDEREKLSFSFEMVVLVRAAGSRS